MQKGAKELHDYEGRKRVKKKGREMEKSAVSHTADRFV
jgi:hypothetical protein